MIVALFAAAVLAATAPEPAPITISGAMPVIDFAVQCQHPGMKTDPDARVSACMGYVSDFKRAMALENRSAACQAGLEKDPPGAVAEMIFYLATLPDEQNKPLAPAMRMALLAVHKDCR